MKIHLLQFSLAIVIGTLSWSSCSGQQSNQKLIDEFKTYDQSANGYLSGTEIAACNCKSFDTNGDNIITDIEFLKGKGSKELVNKERKTLPNNITPKKVNAQSAVGKRVEVNDRAYWYKATIIDQKGDLYKVHFDGYGDSDDKWVSRAYMRDLNANEEPVTVTCSFTPPPGNFSNSSPASDDLFKREVYDWYNRIVNGSLTRPTRIGVVFTTFNRSQPYKNTVTNVPGRGATRKHEGAPVNSTIYPVKMTFHVCEDYNGSVSQKQVNSDFSFFINKDGEWTCSKDN